VKANADGGEMPSAPVPARAKQARETREPREWTWVEPSVWSERMLAALVNGVTGGRWYSRYWHWPHAFFAARGLFTLTEAHALASQSR
jgi:hypothetical protein